MKQADGSGSSFRWVALLVLCGASCGREAHADRPRNAVVFLLDTVRADHLSCYGNARPTTPALDALAARGALFETVVASAPWTKPSICAILSGLHPGRALGKKGLLTHSLVENFAHAGLATAAFTEGGFFSSAYKMDRGFAHFVEEEGAVQAIGPGEQRDEHPKGGIDNTFALASAWLRENKSKPFFLLIHTYEPHAPYTNHDFAQGLAPGHVGQSFTLELVARLEAEQLVLTPAEIDYTRALYDGDVLNTDRHVGAFLALLDELGLANDTLVVVTSDHGEEFGEHHRDRVGGHGHSLCDTLLRVPLIVRDPTLQAAPGQQALPGRIASQVRSIDILPTVAERLGVALDTPLHGASLVPLLERRETHDRPALSGWNSVGPAAVSLRAGGFKYIMDIEGAHAGRSMLHPPDACQLYDLAADPLEQTNLCKTRPELVATLRASLEEQTATLDLRQELPAAGNADERLLERLRSLGYVK